MKGEERKVGRGRRLVNLSKLNVMGICRSCAPQQFKDLPQNKAPERWKSSLNWRHKAKSN